MPRGRLLAHRPVVNGADPNRESLLRAIGVPLEDGTPPAGGALTTRGEGVRAEDWSRRVVRARARMKPLLQRDNRASWAVRVISYSRRIHVPTSWLRRLVSPPL